MFDDEFGYYLFAGFVLLILLEAIVSWRFGRPAYDLAATELNLGVVFGWLLFSPLTALLLVFCIALGNRFAVADFGDGIFGYAALFLIADLIYYLWHLSNHKFAWLWATHNVHHSAERINFLVALRQGWTDVLAGTWLFFAPLGLLGFSPAQCFVYFAALNVWQLLVHNEWTGRLGPLEWIFVTPSGHRVHHSLKPEHVDHNFGGLFIVWDRLFGTFVDEGAERVARFGLADGPPAGAGVLPVVFWGWYPIMSGARKYAASFLRT